MKIAHISDLHFTSLFKENNLENIEFALRYISDTGVDHLAVTGDLTDNADMRDFILLRSLFDKYNFLDSDKLSLVIGNHDIFGGVQKADDIFNFPEKCSSINYNAKVKEFHNFFPETFAGCSYISNENIFPYAKIIKDILIIGLNSNAEYSRIKNPFASNGRIDLQQFFELAELLESYNSCKKKIILVHHHFNKMKNNKKKASYSIWQNIEKQTMKLRKKKKLFYLFKQHGVDLVMHGHYHESKDYFRKGIRFSNAGGSFKGFADKININMISIEDSGIEIEIHKLQSPNVTPIPVLNEQFEIDPEIRIAAAMSF